MPFVSDAQRKYFNANRGKLEAQGVDVDEWNKASKGLKLPSRAKAKKPRAPRASAPKAPRATAPHSPTAMLLGLSASPMHPLLGRR